MKNRLRLYIKESVSKLLAEGLSDIVYHFTHISSLKNILNTNEFNLATAIGSSSDLNVNKGRFFFFSTTRSKGSGYTAGDVKIELNGKKLNQNYKAFPLDYWQYSKNPKDWPDMNSYIQSLQSGEQEDRIVSDKSTIPNASKYIIAIHILFDEKRNEDGIYDYKSIVKNCKKHNISLYFYKDRKDWLLQNKNKVIDIEHFLKDYTKESGDYSKRFDYDIAAFVAFNSDENYQKIIDFLKDDDKIEYFKKTLKERTRNNFKVGSTYSFEAINIISARIHNIRSRTDKNTRFLINLLVRDMKRLGTKTLKEYLETKQWKGKKTLKQYKQELYDYLINIIDSQYQNKLFDEFGFWVEIDGKYFNHAYESPEINKVINKYIDSIKKYIKNQIFSEESEIFDYSYPLSLSYIKDALDIKNAKFSDKIKISDVSLSDVKYLDEKLSYFLLYHIVSEIDDVYLDKTKQLKDEYQKNLYS